MWLQYEPHIRGGGLRIKGKSLLGRLVIDYLRSGLELTLEEWIDYMMDLHAQHHIYRPMRKCGRTELMMNGYIYLYIPWIVIKDTGTWRLNCAVVLKTSMP